MWPLSEPAGAEAATSGHLCEEDGSMAYSVAWQWRLDRHVWQDYRDDIAAIIENTFKSGKNKLDLSAYFPDFPYKISFSTMVQKNKRTKYHRPIRRVTIALPHLPSNLENGSEKDTDGATENLSSYDHDNTSITTDACGSNLTGKKHFIKHVSAFWNKLKKSVDSESSHSSDAEESFTNKKQCTVENATTGSRNSNLLNRNGAFNFDYENTVMNLPNFRPDDTLSASMQFATVNGNVWKQSWPPSTHHSLLKPVPGIPPLPCEDEKPTKKGRRKMVATAIPVEIDVVAQFTEECSISPQENGEEQICIICYESLHGGSPYDDDTTVIRLQLCSHVFHRSCVKAMSESGAKDHLQCPTCKTIHGVKYGNQPPGKMVFHVLPYSLPGYPECDTIRIIYSIHPGIQGPEHPNPGHPYHAYGFPRHCYLPDSEIGRKVLRLLVKAWERRLIFTIGTSATTGATNTVTWNEIHHKTEFGCNRRGHGFPDLNYFENVISELAAHGITESTYSWTPV